MNTYHNKQGKNEYHNFKHNNKEYGKNRYDRSNNHYRNNNNNFGNKSYNRKTTSNKKCCFICNNEDHLAFNCPFNLKKSEQQNKSHRKEI